MRTSKATKNPVILDIANIVNVSSTSVAFWVSHFLEFLGIKVLIMFIFDNILFKMVKIKDSLKLQKKKPSPPNPVCHNLCHKDNTRP